MRRDRPRQPEDVTVAELVDALGARRPPVIGPQASLREAVEAFEEHRHTRVLYVVDDDGVLLGALTAGTLLRHVETHGYVPKVHARRIPALIDGETVADVMLHHPVSLQLGDTVDQAGRAMADAGAKELPVVDGNGRVVADVTIIDVLYHSLVP